MTSMKIELWPIEMTYFFLSRVGFGLPQTKYERKLLNVSLSVFMIMSGVAVYFVLSGLYVKLQQGNTPETMFALFSVALATLTTSKLINFTLQRTSYEDLLRITQEKLWTQSWTDYGEIVLYQCGKQAKQLLFIFVILGHLSGFGFLIEPLIYNWKLNATSYVYRRLPIEPAVGIPIYESPQYEILFTINAVGIYFVTILYFCFDYYLVIINIFVAGQFNILTNRFQEIYLMKFEMSSSKCHAIRKESNTYFATCDFALQEFRDCVRQHQFLIWLVSEIERIYRVINLLQVLMFSFIICLVSYQILIPGTLLTISKYVIFCSSCIIQLFTFTLSCHNVMITSSNVANGIYFSQWYIQNASKQGRSLSKNFMIVLMRTIDPCYLTGCGFFPITLDTLKSILTTAFSYLTLMRQTV